MQLAMGREGSEKHWGPGMLSVPGPGAIRVGVASHVPELLTEFGFDPAPIVSQAGLSLASLQSPDNIVPYAALARLLAISSQQTNCPYFGLLVGQRGRLTSVGAIGLLIAHAENVRTALDELVSHLHVHDRGAVPNLEVLADTALLSYSTVESRIDAAYHIADGAMAVGFNILRALCGPEWSPTEVILPRRTPLDATPYRRFFRAPVRFNGDRATIAFASSWLDRKLPKADHELHHFIESQLLIQTPQNSVGLAEQIRRILRSDVSHEHWSADQIARLLGIHRRTLARRLQLENLTFEQIVDDVRFEIARQLITDTDQPLTNVALFLGYSEPSAFTRAFRRWSGHSPTEWRARATQHGSRR